MVSKKIIIINKYPSIKKEWQHWRIVSIDINAWTNMHTFKSKQVNVVIAMATQRAR